MLASINNCLEKATPARVVRALNAGRLSMCGIAGFAGDFQPGLIQRMNRAQRHRGPDADGVFEDVTGPIALGHRRLSILDLSDAASQPMDSQNGRYTIVFNGEIYNYRELRDELLGKGHQFHTQGDTEVLLAAYSEWGEAAIERLNGIFAFAIWDKRNRELLLVRDPLGIKPLYYAEPQPETLLFASEIKSLCAHPQLRREPDFAALHQHLAYGHCSGTRTPLRGVHRLAPGSLLRWHADTKAPPIRQYSEPTFSAEDASYDDSVEQLAHLVEQATERQMVSDVPVGTFLSGGLDSSLLTILAARSEPNLECYTTSYSAEDNRYDQAEADVPYARRLAESKDLSLHELVMQSDVAELWPKLIHHLDEPIADPAAIACYLICQEAKRRGTTVLLSGQGADELFAGYPRYWVMQRTGWTSAIPAPLRRLTAAAAGLLPGALPGRAGATLRRVRRVLTSAHLSPQQRFLAYCTATAESDIRSVLSDDFRSEIGPAPATSECLRRMESGPTGNVDRFLERDLGVYLPNHNLLYTDKMSMAVGVEARVPLLDNEVVRFANRLPANHKIHRGLTKRVLRDAARKTVPDWIIDRPKAGFGAPYRTWLRNDLAEMWEDLTSPAAVASRGWLDSQALESIRHQSTSGKVDLYMLQWAVLTLEIWARQFIDANPAEVAGTDGSATHVPPAVTSAA